MIKKQNNKKTHRAESGVVLQVNLLGAIVFSLALIFAAEMVSVSGPNTTVIPDNDLVLSLSPQIRAKLYHELARSPENQHMRFPFCYPENTFEESFATNKVSPAVTAEVRKLLYPRGELK